MAFLECTSLASVTIGSEVTMIEASAFNFCTSLTSVTFQGDNVNFEMGTGGFTRGFFPGNLHTVYNGRGTYTRASDGTVWTKQ
jgi:hypothetical protein